MSSSLKQTASQSERRFKRLVPVDYSSVSFDGGFWKSWLDTVRNVTIPTQHKRLEEEGFLEVLDFDKHTAIENYIDSLPEPIREAIKAQKVVEGMDREQVFMAKGTPVRKSRQTKDDVDYEDYIYGKAPGVMTFVTFAGAKVSRIQEFYVGINGSTADNSGPIK